MNDLALCLVDGIERKAQSHQRDYTKGKENQFDTNTQVQA
jgi:hypothetical protein